MLGYHPQAGRAAVHGIELAVVGKFHLNLIFLTRILFCLFLNENTDGENREKLIIRHTIKLSKQTKQPASVKLTERKIIMKSDKIISKTDNYS